VALPVLERLQSSDDASLLVQLGQRYDALGKADLAEKTYERVLRLDPLNPGAAANLAIYRARKGRSMEAIGLWQDIFSRNPALISAGINLMRAQIGRGDREAAARTLKQLLRFQPDLDVEVVR
jgi:Flp pilus assembly protein TadD